MRAWFLIVVAGCYSPHPQTGSPCSDTQPCPATLVCSTVSQTCEVSTGSTEVDAATDAVVPPDGCVPSREFCGDGIDQDCNGIDPPCPVNDTPATPTDIGAGGTFTADLSYAHDDAMAPGSVTCGTPGGRDVYYAIHSTVDEVYYIDTFGSDFDTAIRVYHDTTCPQVIDNGFCRNDICGTLQSQYAGTMSGENCIVLRQRTSAETNGHLVMHVERTHRTGTRLISGTAMTGTTCGAGNDYSGTCGGAGPNSDFYIATCPGTSSLTATTCAAGTLYNTSLFVAGGSGTQLACNDDDAACVPSATYSTLTNVQLSGAHLFWVIVDSQTVAGCGAYSLTATLN